LQIIQCSAVGISVLYQQQLLLTVFKSQNQSMFPDVEKIMITMQT